MRYLVILAIFITSLFAAFESIGSLSATFLQEVDSGNNKILYKGKIFLKKPNYALWRYSEPIPKEVYLYGDKLVIFEPDLEQATVSNIRKNLDIFSILRNSKKIDENLYSGAFEGQLFSIKSRDGVPIEISYSDKLDNRVTIYFKSIQENIEIDDSEFIFKAGENIDIIYAN